MIVILNLKGVAYHERKIIQIYDGTLWKRFA